MHRERGVSALLVHILSLCLCSSMCHWVMMSDMLLTVAAVGGLRNILTFRLPSDPGSSFSVREFCVQIGLLLDPKLMVWLIPMLINFPPSPTQDRPKGALTPACLPAEV